MDCDCVTSFGFAWSVFECPDSYFAGLEYIEIKATECKNDRLRKQMNRLME